MDEEDEEADTDVDTEAAEGKVLVRFGTREEGGSGGGCGGGCASVVDAEWLGRGGLRAGPLPPLPLLLLLLPLVLVVLVVEGFCGGGGRDLVRDSVLCGAVVEGTGEATLAAESAPAAAGGVRLCSLPPLCDT